MTIRQRAATPHAWLVTNTWGRVKEPKVLSFLAWAGYLTLMAAGAGALVAPIAVITTPVAAYIATIAAAFTLIGASAGALGALPGWRAVERWGIGLTGSGITAYLALSLVAGAAGGAFMLALTIFVLVSLLGRLLHIKDGIYTPGSPASIRARARHPEVTVNTGQTETISRSQ